MMSIFGTVKRGQKVVIVRGTGFEFTIHSAGAGKIKTPVATGAGEAQLKSYTKMSSTAFSGVNHKIDCTA